MADINEIRRSLCSDKITIRKKGKTDCEALLSRDKTIFASNHVQTMEFLRAVMEYEVKEIDAGQAKGKKLNLDVSSFVKKTMKYCLSYGQIISVKFTVVLEHILNILYDDTLPLTYKNDHRYILCDILEPRNTHSIPFDKKDRQLHVGLNKLFLYLRDVMNDSKSASDTNNLKLLRLLCRSMFSDNSNHPECILKYLLQWFHQLLKTAAETATTHPQLTACLADCCRYFIDYQGANLALTVFGSVDLLVQLVIKQLSSHQFRETHRNAFVKFLLRLMDISSVLNWKYIALIPSANPLSRHMSSLCEVVCGDDGLRGLMFFGTSSTLQQTAGGGSLASRQQNQTRDSCPCVLDDPKVSLNYELVARVSYHHQALCAVIDQQLMAPGNGRDDGVDVFANNNTMNSNYSRNSNNTSSSSSSSNRPHQTTQGEDLFASTQSNKKQRTQQAIESPSSLLSVDCILSRLKQLRGAVLSAGNGRSGMTQTQQSVNTPFGTQFKTQGGGGATQSASSSSGLRQGKIQLHDSLVHVAIALFRQYPALDFLAVQSLSAKVLQDSTAGLIGGPSIHAISSKLCEWVEVFRGKLEECLQLSGAVDFQHCGLLLIALTELARVTHCLMGLSSGAAQSSLRSVWLGVISLLMESRALLRLASSAVCRRDSVTARLLSLLRLVVGHSLLEPASLGKCRRAMWTSANAADPSLADSPEVFWFLSALTRASSEDVSLDLCIPFVAAVRERLSDEMYDPDSGGSGGVDPHVGTLLGLVESARRAPLVQFVALWLMDGMQCLKGHEGTGSSRLTIAHTHSFNIAIGDLLRANVTEASQSVCSVDIVDASRRLREQSALHWLELPPSLAAISHDSDIRDSSAFAANIVHAAQAGVTAGKEDCVYALSLLDCVKDKMLAMRIFVIATGGSAAAGANFSSSKSGGGRSGDEFSSSPFAVSGDGSSGSEGVVSPWQTTGVLLLNAYAAIAQSLRGYSLHSDADRQEMRQIRLGCVDAYLQVLHSSLVYLQGKVLLTKPVHLADYLCEVVFTIKCISQTGDGAFDDRTENKCKQCCDLLHAVLRVLQKESTNNKHGGASAGESLDDLEFDRGERGAVEASQAALVQRTGSGASRAKRSNTETFAGGDDDEGDFMDGPASSSSTSSSSRVNKVGGAARGRVAPRASDPGGDSDMDVEDIDGDGYVQARRADGDAARGFSGKMHSVYSPDQLRSLVAAMQSVLLLTTSNTPGVVSTSANKIVTYLSVMEAAKSPGGGRGAAPGGEHAVRLLTPSEVYLTIAQHLSLLQPTTLVVATVRSLVDRCPWHIEWGPLGFCKVLGIIQQLTSQENFWKEHATERDAVDDVVQYFVSLVLPQDDKALETFPAAQFQVRILQLECVANVMQYGSEAQVADIKASITPLFVGAMEDRDARVRLCAARKLPLLLMHFKKPDKVYTALVSATHVSLLYVPTNAPRHTASTLGNEEDAATPVISSVDPLLVLTAAVAIARMGCSEMAVRSPSMAITRKALLDLMVLCCSRHKHVQSISRSKPHTQTGARSSQLKQSQLAPDESTDLLHGCLDYRDVLFRLVTFMARSLGYSSGSQLLSEYMRWLLHQWLVAGDVTGSEREVDEETMLPDGSQDVDSSPLSLSMADFPYQLFLSAEQKTHGTNGENFAQFLTSQSETVLPLMASITNHRLRWSLLQQFLTDCGMQSSDRNMVLVVRQNVSSIKALEFSVFFAGMSRQLAGEEGDDSVYAEAMRTVQALQLFVSRNLNSAEINLIVSTKLSDTIQALFVLQTFERAAECERPLHESRDEAVTVDAAEDFLATILTKICDLAEVNRIELLLVKCNVLELLAALRNRLLQTRLDSVCRTILAAVRLMIKHIPVLSSACFGAMLGIVKLSIDSYPGELASSVTVLRELTESLCREKHLVEGALSPSVQVNIPHLFSELSILLAAVSLTIKKKSTTNAVVAPTVTNSTSSSSSSSSSSNVGGRLKRTRAVVEEDLFFEEDEDIDLFRAPPSQTAGKEDSSTVSVFGEVYFASLHKIAAVSTEDLGGTQRVVSSALERLWRFVKGSGNEVVLRACLPLPTDCVTHIASEEVRDEVSSALWLLTSVKDRCTSFVALARRILNGEVFELSILWVGVSNLRDALEGRAAPTAGPAVQMEGLWTTEPALAATCVSSLLGLCEHRLPLNCSAPDADHNVIREMCLTLLGHIGPPDLFSLSHGADFPARIGDIARDCDFNVPQMKLSIVQRVFSLLTVEHGQGYAQSSQCLRVLSSVAYFENADQVLTGHLAHNRHLREIVDAYKVSVQPRYQSSPENRSSTNADRNCEEAFTEALWAVDGDGAYSHWVTRVTHGLITSLYSSSSAGAVDGSGPTKKANSLVTQSSDSFLCACAEVCLLRVDIAETVFQLVVADLLAVNGAQSYLCDKLSQCMRQHMFSPTCPLQRVTQLGCQTLTLLLRRDVTCFLDKSQRRLPVALQDASGTIPSKARRVEPSKTNDDCDWRLPFSYLLNIDYHYVAAAATRCQSVCSALLFAELGAERSRHTVVRAVRASSTTNTDSSAHAKSSLRPSSDKSALNALLIPIFRGMHDPDALHGVADMSLSGGGNLALQAVMYEHEGHWMEALSTYETIIQSRVGSRGGEDGAAEEGVLRALEGLGAMHTLGHFRGNAHVNDSRADAASLALQTWSPALNVHVNAASNKRKESDPEPHTDAHDALSVCIASAVRDLTQKNVSSAQNRIAASTRLLVADMSSRSGEQCARNIVGDLSLAQQLREIVEVCDVLDRSKRSTPFSAEDLLRRWRARDGKNAGHLQHQSLRFALLSNLLQCDALTAPQAVECLTAVLSTVKSRDKAHSVSPLVYKYWNLISDHVTHGKVANRTSDTLSLGTSTELKVLHAQWALYECKLLWRKGLKEVAINNVTNKVVNVLKDLLPAKIDAVSTSNNSSSSSSSNSAVKVFGGRGSTRGGVSARDDSRVRNLMSEALRVGGEWMSTKRAATGTEILEDFLVPATSFAEGVAERIRAHETLGGFNSRLHQNVKTKIESAEWKQGARVLADRMAELEQCKAMQAAERLTRDPKAGVSADTKALYRHVNMLKKEVESDTRDRLAVEASVDKYLLAAIRDYGQVLALSADESLDAVFRVVNLWLSNSESAHVNNLVDEIMESVASYKFVPLTYQVFSRLGKSAEDSVALVDGEDLEPLHAVLRRSASSRSVNSGPGRASKLNKGVSISATSSLLPKTTNDLFQFVLARMVFKLCSEHPHHTLAQLFALANEREMGASYDGAAQYQSNSSSNKRCEAANAIVEQLLHCREVAELVGATQTLLLAYIELAKTTTETFQKSGKIKDIKYKEIQSRGKRFNECLATLPAGSLHRPAVITDPLRLNPLRDYRGAPRTVDFLPTFSITENGISRPKIICCLSSDGQVHKQLVKGGDDMRQDAVMEQVFEAVNHMLRGDDEATKRALGIRTYKIIPTTPQTGVLQWVENTTPFGSILYDKESGTHNRYYSSDPAINGPSAVNDAEWSHLQCREHLKDAADNADKLLKFHEVMDHFHPSLRFFFLERFADPAKWMASRLAYVRSVAVTSMVGYILGIGDRHAHNILVDTLTAEVVHIDFGIVYEQGKGLGAPETVPFRLTRDIVDGMGVTGVEGTFRRSSEEVLRVLRDNALQIMTILEVVIHDPLYKWSLSPLQARMKQKETAPDFQLNVSAKGAHQPPGSAHQTAGGVQAQATTAKQGGNFGKDTAERTLTRIKNKLQGHEDPTGEALSVEGLVDLLINEARSPNNLCRLFPGWAPWL